MQTTRISLDRRAPRSLAALCATGLIFAAACGNRSVGEGGGADRETRERSALEQTYPALVHLPADASWAMACKTERGCLDMANEVAGLGSLLLGVSQDDLRAQLGGSLVVALSDPRGLAKSGVDVERSGLVFGRMGATVLVIPTSDPAKADGYLAATHAGEVAPPVTHRGVVIHQVASEQGPPLGWGTLKSGELVVALSSSTSPPEGWLTQTFDAVIDAKGGTPKGRLGRYLQSAYEYGGGGSTSSAPPMIAAVDVALVAAEVGAMTQAAPGISGCIARASEVTPFVTVFGTDAGDEVRISLAAELRGAHADALREHSGPAPRAGLARYMQDAPLSLGFAVATTFLERVRVQAACPLWSTPVGDPVRDLTGRSGPKAMFLAATEIDVDDMDGAGALELVLTDRALISEQLDAIPARSLFESEVRIGATKVQRLSIPGVATIHYVQQGDRFVAALGRDAMERALGQDPAARTTSTSTASSSASPNASQTHPAIETGSFCGYVPEPHLPPTALAHFALSPNRLPNLPQVVALLASLAGAPGDPAELTRRLRAYQRLSIDLQLHGHVLLLDARSQRLR